MPIRWFEHNGVRILEIDYRGLDESGMLELVEEAAREFERAGVDLVTLDRFEGVSVSSKFMEKAKPLGKTVFEPRRKKGAIVGNMGGFAMTLFSFYCFFTGSKLKPFESAEKAKDWLAEP